MATSTDPSAIFTPLKQILAGHAESLVVVADSETNYHLDAHHVMKNKKPLFFGAVKTNKNYVSYHLMPVYINASLLDSISEPLRRRMHGKSCFNFKAVEDELFKELIGLTESGYQFYVKEGYIPIGREA